MEIYRADAVIRVPELGPSLISILYVILIQTTFLVTTMQVCFFKLEAFFLEGSTFFIYEIKGR